MSRCLICYEPSNGVDYHSRCAIRFFQTQQVPLLPYGLDDLKELAKNELKRSSASVTGVQEKISLDIKKDSSSKRLTFVGIWGRFILKPPTDKYPEIPAIEHVSMVMAKNAKLMVVPHALIKMASGELAYMSRRIDRLRTGEKLHMEDMCQLTERLTEDKYKSSMENIARTIKKYSGSMLDIVRFFEITVFSFLIGNADMHLKNFSLIRKNTDNIMLSPAYDLLSTRLLISERDDPEEMALTINGKKRRLTRNDFNAFGKTIGLMEKQIKNTMALMQESLPLFYKLIGLSFLSNAMKENFTEIVKLRAKRLGI